MTTPRLVATDLDGTLVRTDGSVSPYTRDVLAELDRRGIPVVFVTGRPLRWAREVFEYVGSHGLAIASNGALVWDVAGEKVWLERPIAPNVALDVARRLREVLPRSRFAVEVRAGFGMEPHFMRHEADAAGVELRRAPLEELAAEPVLKLLARHSDIEPDDYWRQADAAVGELVTVTHSSKTALLEISAFDVTKASTLALVAAELGIAATDVIAFGDMPNDLPMLRWAGTSYAMCDAHPEVLACAANVAPGHDEDGVAKVLVEVMGL